MKFGKEAYIFLMVSYNSTQLVLIPQPHPPLTLVRGENAIWVNDIRFGNSAYKGTPFVTNKDQFPSFLKIEI